jgi:L-threonylcarbamoyladenylate synthase
VERAVAALKTGGVVVLPTETVYGLAADSHDPRAVARVYAIKGRPADHPLIVHLAVGADLNAWALRVPDYAAMVARELWPGPMTLVLRRSARVGDFVTGGQDTVAIRVPDHPVAQAILARFGGGVVAPSANLFGHVSPTTAAHAAADLGDRLDPERDVVVDGGPCRVGVESTIIDCTGEVPRILRPGSIGERQIAQAAALPVIEAGSARIRVPGSHLSHYAPRARVRLAEQPPPAATPVCGLLALDGVPTPRGLVRLAAPATSDEYARVLYQALREADALRLEEVVAVLPPGGDAAAVAVRDRLRRAATDPHQGAQP